MGSEMCIRDRVVNSSLAKFCFVDWCTEDRNYSYSKLLEAAQQANEQVVYDNTGTAAIMSTTRIETSGSLNSYVVHSDGDTVIAGGRGMYMRVWDIQSGKCYRVLRGHVGEIHSIAWNVRRGQVLSASADCTVRHWDLNTEACLRTLTGHTAPVTSIVWGRAEIDAWSGSEDGNILRRHLSNFFGQSQANSARILWEDIASRKGAKAQRLLPVLCGLRAFA